MTYLVRDDRTGRPPAENTTRVRSLLHLVPSCGPGDEDSDTGPFVFGRPLLNLGHALRLCGLISGPMSSTPQSKMLLLVNCHIGKQHEEQAEHELRKLSGQS
jgi:hypothetical protein